MAIEAWIDYNAGTITQSHKDIYKWDISLLTLFKNSMDYSPFNKISKYITHKKTSEITFWHNTCPAWNLQLSKRLTEIKCLGMSVWYFTSCVKKYYFSNERN